MKKIILIVLVISCAAGKLVLAAGELPDTASSERIPVGATIDITRTIVFAAGSQQQPIGSAAGFRCIFSFGAKFIPQERAKFEPTVLSILDVVPGEGSINFFLRGNRNDADNYLTILCWHRRSRMPTVGHVKDMFSQSGMRLNTDVIDATDAKPLQL